MSAPPEQDARGSAGGPAHDATFITRLDHGTGDGPTLAVKDLIDVAGVPTTGACRAVANRAKPADVDAACVASARAAGARIVGKTNLHELGIGTTGINPSFGTPVNPLDPDRVPGGSSSGSAVAVATGEADVAYGTDTGGSCRIPAACCGVVGLKTTSGRIATAGVMVGAPSLDTVGPMARDVAGLVTGMRLLEPGFAPAASGPRRVGRVATGVHVDPIIDAAVDRALEVWSAVGGVEIVPVTLEHWQAGFEVMSLTFLLEFRETSGHLLEYEDELGPGVAATLRVAESVTDEQRDDLTVKRQTFVEELDTVLADLPVLALPTLPAFPPRLDTDDPVGMSLAPLPAAVNAAGTPAVALPIPTDAPLPASLQLVAQRGGDELLLAAATEAEEATTAGS